MSTGRDFTGNGKIVGCVKAVLEIIKAIITILSQLEFNPGFVAFHIYLQLWPSKPVTAKACNTLALGSCFRYRSFGVRLIFLFVFFIKLFITIESSLLFLLFFPY